MSEEGGPSAAWLDRRRRQVDPELQATFGRSFEMGFLGGMPIADQIDHALGFVEIVESELGRPPVSVIDLGTGGGMPGLVLSSCWPDTRVVLVDASQRRTEFLVEVVESWPAGSRTEVVRGRAEELGRRPDLREMIEVVTSRSFGPPSATAECAAPFLRVGGVMVVSEPPDSPPVSAGQPPGWTSWVSSLSRRSVRSRPTAIRSSGRTALRRSAIHVGPACRPSALCSERSAVRHPGGFRRRECFTWNIQDPPGGEHPLEEGPGSDNRA